MPGAPSSLSLSCCPLLAGFSGSLLGIYFGHSVRQCWQALSGCPPLLLLSFSVLSSSCSSIAFLLSFFGSSLAKAASLSPVVLLPSSCCASLVLSLPLLLLVSSWYAPYMLFCCPFGVVRSQLVLLLSSWRVRVVFLPSSFCPLLSSLYLLMSSSGLSVVLLLSCCLRSFPRQGLGCSRQQEFLPAKLFGVYVGIMFFYLKQAFPKFKHFQKNTCFEVMMFTDGIGVWGADAIVGKDDGGMSDGDGDYRLILCVLVILAFTVALGVNLYRNPRLKAWMSGDTKHRATDTE